MSEIDAHLCLLVASSDHYVRANEPSSTVCELVAAKFLILDEEFENSWSQLSASVSKISQIN
jgi:hypothetical protein